MSLDLKHRPPNLEAIIGNEDLVKSLSSVLAKKDKPHSYLLTGPSGCGKTTIGRIIKSMLECSDRDYHEINSADARGIDDVRAIQKQMMFKPSGGPVQVWVIDECHKMTNDAQNAFLKTLEEPYQHVYIVLCTTDPQKLLKTIKTRCTSFEVEELSSREISKLLKKTIKKENKEIEKEVLNQIIKDSLGCPRMALKILDKIIDLPEEEQLECAKQAAEQESQTIELCRILMKDNPSWKSIAGIIKNLLKTTSEESIRRAVLGYFNAVLLNSGNPVAYHIMSCFEQSYFYSGKAGLTISCWEAIQD